MKEKADFMEEIGLLFGYAQSYFEDQVEYLQLEMAERTSKIISTLIVALILGLFSLVILLLLSIALAIFLGEVFGSPVIGFLILSGLYLMVGIVLVIFRRALLTAPITLSIIKHIIYDQE